MHAKENDKGRISDIFNRFAMLYPEPRCELNYETPFQLLISTVLAAHATDKKVNEVTARLFKKYNKPEDFLSLTREELAQEIRSIHHCYTKARYILEICKKIIAEYGGQVPKTQKELMKLPGVGRKTANVVLGEIFNIPSIAVDTHVFRVANRMGLVDAGDVLKTELELQKLIPVEQWIIAHNYLVLHGRRVCDAKKPKCNDCGVAEFCRRKYL